MKAFLKDLSLDPRYYQIGFQTVFLIFGVWVLGWQTEWPRIGVYFMACLGTQFIVNLITKTSMHSLKSAFITALGLGLLLNTNDLLIAALAGVVAIASKSVIRFKGKHLFNPANIGILVAVVLAQKAWISPGQWGSHPFFPVAIILAGLIILSKVKRVETGFIFYGTLILLELGRQYFYLGWPIDAWWHRVSNGSILVYALFMITDPKTTPNHRTARIIWAVTLAIATFIIGYGMQLYAAPIYALFLWSPLTAVFDKIFVENKFQWKTIINPENKLNNTNMMKKMMKFSVKPLLLAAVLVYAQQASAFCGFYVAQAGASVFNNKSEVILVRDGQRTTITMRNDFKGNLKQFAMVIPVPVVLKRNDIQIKENSLFNSLDQYSAPRLVEYFDNNPCVREREYYLSEDMNSFQLAPAMSRESGFRKDEKKKVVIEAQYSIDEYEIIILSAKESGALQAWLEENGYSVPANAKEVLTPYIKDNMKFFAVKVNLEKAKNLPNGYLRPIQITFESKKFMLPIRLGMANAENNGEQDLIIYAFTKTGRVETANYRTVEMPTARKIPTFAKREFATFYKEMFDRKYKYEGENATFLEYAWNVSPTWGVKCDPCTGTPPVVTDLANSGVSWVDPNANYSFGNTSINVFFTRLHVRYDREHFPSDLTFIETPNTENYQVRQIITNPAQGSFDCEQGLSYLKELKNRRILELQEMASLTGRNTKSYPFYVEMGSGKVKSIPNNGGIEDEDEESFLPIYNSGKRFPPFWVLPLLILAVLVILKLPKLMLKVIS